MPRNEHRQSSRGDDAAVPRTGRLATITLRRARCPRCGGVRLRRYRSIRDQGDGSALSWVRCQSDGCGHRFKLLLE